MTPFLSFYTPTFRVAGGALARPKALEACRQSVSVQIALPAGAIQHELVVDQVSGGSGVGGMFTQVPLNATRMTGEYVHILADDDVLHSQSVVSSVMAFARQHDNPPVILVNAWKHLEQGWLRLPVDWAGVPVCGLVDLGCIITRRDVWQAHAADYGDIYEGDFRFLDAVHKAGHRIERFDLDFVRGAVMRGKAE